MKKLFYTFAAVIAAVMSSCTNEQIDTIQPSFATDCMPDGISFNVNVGDTKAVVNDWQENDKIYVFFDDCAAQTSDSDLNYLLLTYDGSKWGQTLHQLTEDELKTYLLGKKSGKFDAVYGPYGGTGVKKSPYDTGKYTVNNGCFRVLTQVQGDYSVSGEEVTLTVTLTDPYQDYIQVYVEGLELTSTEDWRLSVYDASGLNGLKRYEGVQYTPQNHTFGRFNNKTPKEKGMNGSNWKDGAVYYGVKTGDPKNLTFELWNAKGTDKLFYSIASVPSFEPGMAIKLLLSSFEEPCTYRTVLYADGTLIIDEKSTEIEVNSAIHGMEAATYDSWHDAPASYSFSGKGAAAQPWASERTEIVRVEFGSLIAPVSMAFWFTQCANLESLDFTNLDTSACTNMNSMFNQAFTAISTPIDLDLSSFNVSALSDSKALQNFMYKATKVKSVDVSGWVIKNAFDAQNAFQSYNGALERIYADSKTDFTVLASPANLSKTLGMFKNNPNLVGDNGSTISILCRDLSLDANGASYATYARIDTDETPGYFSVRKTTVLFEDGTLVINEPFGNIEEDIRLHGSLIANYNTVVGGAFAKEGAPWNADRNLVTSVKFGSPTKPASMVYWFYQCKNLREFDWTNLNTSKCTNLSNTFYGVCQAIVAGEHPTEQYVLDLSGWDISALTGKALQNTFSGANGIAVLDLTGWVIPAAVTDCQNCFRNMLSCKTIYVSENIGFDSIATTTNMLWMNDDSTTPNLNSVLVGGNGTAYDYKAAMDNTFAVVDKPGQKGYFTLSAK